ncbi:MAG: hypothetical protein ACFFDW_10620 [Candidatus Thorarchaeota archaeon]
MPIYNQTEVSSTPVTKSIFKMGVTCIDERINSYPYDLSFRFPGASIFPRGDEPSYSLASILFYTYLANDYNTVLIDVADHGTIKDQGYVDCGMDNILSGLSILKSNIAKESSLDQNKMDQYLTRLALYDIRNVGGIGRHSQWEKQKLKELTFDFEVIRRALKILPNSPEKEQIPNERMILIRPFVDQDGLLTNIDENGNSFDGSSIIQTFSGMPKIEDDYSITNGLVLFSYAKGETIRELLVLEGAIKLYENSKIRSLFSKIDFLDINQMRKLTEKIQEFTNMDNNECYRYLQSIKELASINLYGAKSQQLEQAKKTAQKIKELNILPKRVVIKYGLVDTGGKLIDTPIVIR